MSVFIFRVAERGESEAGCSDKGDACHEAIQDPEHARLTATFVEVHNPEDGDPERGIPPCAGCHGPLGHKIGAPVLTGQHATYIAWQLADFAQGMRQNDINEQMRMPAGQLTPDEMHMIADFLGADRR